MWSLKNNNGEFIPATSENIINSLNSGKVERISEQEERATEKRYMQDFNMIVKCYWDGNSNIIDLTPDIKQ
ncbi:hypothetical protein [Flavobacterium sp. GNP002]